MFKTFARKFLPNPFDAMLKKTAKRGGKKILLGWNRGLGDLALGLYAMIGRIREWIPDAEITFVTRENLKDGFSMLEGVKVIIAPHWKRGEEYLLESVVDTKLFDLVIEKPSPTDWVFWQRGKIVPRLKWDSKHSSLFERFKLPPRSIGVQVVAETQYGLWRNWPLPKWEELFERLKAETFLLFGFGNEPKIHQKNVIDLRGKTDLFELLSIIQNRCKALILPDSGILSMAYYLDLEFDLKLISLWADANHGILKQAVPSPNPKLVHVPLIQEKRGLSQISVHEVIKALYPEKPLEKVAFYEDVKLESVGKVAALLLAGGQGSRLGVQGPKGLFKVHGKPLFNWSLEKLPKGSLLAVMVSPLNKQETIDHFEKNHFFGLDVHFFEQEMSSFLSEKKKETKEKGPSGNGSVFRSFLKAGLGDLFKRKGVEYVSVFYVDNPLANPFEPKLISYAKDADVTIQCIERKEEAMGALVEREGNIEIVEYTELDLKKRYPFAYSGQMVFKFPFFCEMGDIELPVHWVRKKVGSRWIYKGEKFIFDVLPYAKSVRAIAAPREKCYAPLKSLSDLPTLEKILGLS